MTEPEKTTEELMQEMVEQMDDLSPQCVISGWPVDAASTFPSGMKLYVHPYYHRSVTKFLLKNATATFLREAIVLRDAWIAAGEAVTAKELEVEIIELEKTLWSELTTYIIAKKIEHGA